MTTSGTLLLATLAIAIRVGAAPCPAAAQEVHCGDTIGPGVKVKLTADVGPCDAATNPAIRVIGSATLDMAGHRLICDKSNPPDGIQLEGKGVKLLRGHVQDCSSGLFLLGEGGHKVDGFVAEGGHEGVQVNSNKNKIRNVSANNNDDDGFDVESNGNKLQQVDAAGNADNGFEIDGDGNTLQNASASGNGNDGYQVEGDASRVKGCVAVLNEDDGIDLDGDGNKVEKCRATRNGGGGSDAGIAVGGDGNQAKKNLVTDNDPHGIRATDGANGNQFAGNIALAHEAGTDLRDENPGGTCDGNTWKKDTFATSAAAGTSNPPCIR